MTKCSILPLNMSDWLRHTFSCLKSATFLPAPKNNHQLFKWPQTRAAHPQFKILSLWFLVWSYRRWKTPSTSHSPTMTNIWTETYSWACCWGADCKGLEKGSPGGVLNQHCTWENLTKRYDWERHHHRYKHPSCWACCSYGAAGAQHRKTSFCVVGIPRWSQTSLLGIA